MKVHRAVGLLMLLVACGVTGCQPKALSDGAASSAGGSGASASGSAADALARLTVRPAGSMATYDRIKDFGPAWTDNTTAPGGHNHCDTRVISMLRAVMELFSQRTWGVVGCA